MNYLQLKDDSTFATEEACLAEYFGDGNYVPFHAKEILQRRIKLKKGDFHAAVWAEFHFNDGIAVIGGSSDVLLKRDYLCEFLWPMPGIR